MFFSRIFFRDNPTIFLLAKPRDFQKKNQQSWAVAGETTKVKRAQFGGDG